MIDKLKPCPFCGGEAHTEVMYDTVGGGELKLSAYILCYDCGTAKKVQFSAEKAPFEAFDIAFEQAAQKWNQRAGEDT